MAIWSIAANYALLCRKQFCGIQQLLSGQGLPHFLVAKLETFPQLISNEVSDCIPNIYWICSHIFELGDLQLLESTQFFTPVKRFSANNFTSRYAILFVFSKAWKAIDSFTCVPNFLFSDIYLNLFFFNFKVGPLLDLSSLMYSMFIIIIIIRIIKTTCFNNTILMAELEGKLSWSRWSLSAHNSPSSGYFHKIFCMHLQKGLIYLCTKTF